MLIAISTLYRAKCYFQTGHDLTAGLEVINNTNLGFFSLSQRAEFFALKGIFLSKLDHPEEANQAFSTAIQVEQKLSKGWSAWGQYCDDVFEVKREDLSLAANAISCYLNAAGICKNARSRKFLARVLWLLGFDDESGVLSNAFEAYKGEHSIWYWISFIPQLITSLTRPEAKHAKNILIRIARAFPQVWVECISLLVHLTSAFSSYFISRCTFFCAAPRRSLPCAQML